MRRPKKGFGVAVGYWSRGRLNAVLSPKRIARNGWFDASAVALPIGDHLDAKRDNRQQLRTLFVVELWHDGCPVKV